MLSSPVRAATLHPEWNWTETFDVSVVYVLFIIFISVCATVQILEKVMLALPYISSSSLSFESDKFRYCWKKSDGIVVIC